MKVVLLKQGGSAEITEIEDSLESYQSVVGGYIETLYFSTDPVVLICNEEGKVYGLPYNRAIKNDHGEIVDIIAGEAFICGLSEESFDSLSNELAEKYFEMYKNPQVFYRHADGRIYRREVDLETGALYPRELCF